MLAFQTESGYILEAKFLLMSVTHDKCHRPLSMRERNLIASLNISLSALKSVVQEKKGEVSK